MKPTVNRLTGFPDVDKFVESVTFYQRNVGIDQLSEKKHFRLRKHLTTIRKWIGKRRKPKIVYCNTFNITIYNASHGVFSLLFSLALFPNFNFFCVYGNFRFSKH